jgi:hypothetical protein
MMMMMMMMVMMMMMMMAGLGIGGPLFDGPHYRAQSLVVVWCRVRLVSVFNVVMGCVNCVERARAQGRG